MGYVLYVKYRSFFRYIIIIYKNGHLYVSKMNALPLITSDIQCIDLRDSGITIIFAYIWPGTNIHSPWDIYINPRWFTNKQNTMKQFNELTNHGAGKNWPYLFLQRSTSTWNGNQFSDLWLHAAEIICTWLFVRRRRFRTAFKSGEFYRYLYILQSVILKLSTDKYVKLEL